LIGRAHLYGLAVAGEAGVRHCIDILAAELRMSMALCGARSIAELDPSLIRQRQPKPRPPCGGQPSSARPELARPLSSAAVDCAPVPGTGPVGLLPLVVVHDPLPATGRADGAARSAKWAAGGTLRAGQVEEASAAPPVYRGAAPRQPGKAATSSAGASGPPRPGCSERPASQTSGQVLQPEGAPVGVIPTAVRAAVICGRWGR
jgi:hypothetical protein